MRNKNKRPVLNQMRIGFKCSVVVLLRRPMYFKQAQTFHRLHRSHPWSSFMRHRPHARNPHWTGLPGSRDSRGQYPLWKRGVFKDSVCGSNVG